MYHEQLTAMKITTVPIAKRTIKENKKNIQLNNQLFTKTMEKWTPKHGKHINIQ
jgi:hypothetical protein